MFSFPKVWTYSHDDYNPPAENSLYSDAIKLEERERERERERELIISEILYRTQFFFPEDSSDCR